MLACPRHRMSGHFTPVPNTRVDDGLFPRDGSLFSVLRNDLSAFRRVPLRARALGTPACKDRCPPDVFRRGFGLEKGETGDSVREKPCVSQMRRAASASVS